MLRIGLAMGVIAMVMMAAGDRERGMFVRPALAQEITREIPRINEAESDFERGLEAYRAGDYGLAFRRFRQVVDDYPLNRKTTAASLMAAKALYRDGRYDRAIESVDAFLRAYPSSRYIEEARRVSMFAEQQLEHLARSESVFRLGVILPMTGAGAVTQSMFNGIRIAVEAHNRASGDVMPVQMVFRDSHGDPSTAREVVADLAREDVDAIIGPIFSDEARAAADEAERRRIVLIAPLATDEDVALDRRFVFQANPPISTRGRVMARYALRQGENEVGVIARLGDAISERMAEGFENELYEEGGELAFYHLLESENGWTRLASEVGPDTLARTPALYLALSGGSARVPAEAALQSLEEAGLRPRIYGSDGWHHINQEDRASRFETTYATDFYVDETSSGVQNFRRRYQTLADADPDRPAFMGFDVATYILSRSVSRRGDDLIEILRNDISYQGLSTRLDFSRSNVNQALFIFGYRDGDRELLR